MDEDTENYIEDLCSLCKKNKADYMLEKEGKISWNECTDLLYSKCERIPIPDRLKVSESINNIYKLIISIRPIAVILNLEFIVDKYEVKSHLKKLKRTIIKLQNSVKSARTVELAEIRNQSSEIRDEIYEDTYMLPIMKRLLMFQAWEYANLQNFNRVEYSRDDLYTISKNSAVLQNLAKKEANLLEQKYELEMQRMRDEHQKEIEELKAKYKAKKKEVKKLRKHADSFSQLDHDEPNYQNDVDMDAQRFKSEQMKKLKLENQQPKEHFEHSAKDLQKDTQNLEYQIKEAKNEPHRFKEENEQTKEKYLCKTKNMNEKFDEDQEHVLNISFMEGLNNTKTDDGYEGLSQTFKKSKSNNDQQADDVSNGTKKKKFTKRTQRTNSFVDCIRLNSFIGW